MVMKSALNVEQCCTHCRKPARRCAGAACEGEQTYAGVLLRGEWRPLEADAPAHSASSARPLAA